MDSRNEQHKLHNNHRLVDTNGSNITFNVTSEGTTEDEQNRKVYFGKININNKICFVGVFTILGKDKYRLTSTKNNPLIASCMKQIAQYINLLVIKAPSMNDTDEVTATIFGQEYKGKQILIDGDKVIVDGVLANDEQAIDQRKCSIK